MSSVLQLPWPSSNKTIFLLADIHSHKMHDKTIDSLIIHAESVSYDKRILFIMGDLFEFEEFMAKNPIYKKSFNSVSGIIDYLLPSFEAEMIFGNLLLDRLQRTFSKIIFMKGNHEDRIDQFLKTCPHDFRHNFFMNDSLSLDKRKIKMLEYDKWVYIGQQIGLHHGVNKWHGKSSLDKHFMAARCRTVFIGHLHRHELRSYSQVEDTRYAISLPCSSSCSPEWLRGKPNEWSTGYGVINLFPKEKYFFDVKITTNNRSCSDIGRLF